jgi:homospermidine synthase
VAGAPAAVSRSILGAADAAGAAITAMVVAGLLLVWFLDHPYENRSGSIKPDEMERQLVIIEGEQKNVALPCDEDRHPVGVPA